MRLSKDVLNFIAKNWSSNRAAAVVTKPPPCSAPCKSANTAARRCCFPYAYTTTRLPSYNKKAVTFTNQNIAHKTSLVMQRGSLDCFDKHNYAPALIFLPARNQLFDFRNAQLVD